MAKGLGFFSYHSCILSWLQTHFESTSSWQQPQPWYKLQGSNVDLASLLPYKRGSSCRSPPAPLCVGEANTCQFQGHDLSPVGGATYWCYWIPFEAERESGGDHGLSLEFPFLIWWNKTHLQVHAITTYSCLFILLYVECIVLYVSSYSIHFIISLWLPTFNQSHIIKRFHTSSKATLHRT